MLMFFTSGTTGYPKIAAHNYKYALGHLHHRQVLALRRPRRAALHHLGHRLGQGAVGQALRPVDVRGAPSSPMISTSFDAHDILPMFAKYHITTFCAPPTMYRILHQGRSLQVRPFLHRVRDHGGRGPEPRGLRAVGSAPRACPGHGGLRPDGDHAVHLQPGRRRAEDRLHGHARARFTMSTSLTAGRHACAGRRNGRDRHPYRRARALRPVHGLLPRRGEDRAKPGSDGVYHTGDTAWRDEDGYFWYVGRTDDVIKSSGYRIGPFEIESVIMELPYVLECGVTSRSGPDARAGRQGVASC